MQLTFLRRTAAGPAVLDVQDTKLGSRTSTIHVTLSQARDKQELQGSSATASTAKKQLEVKIAGYITVSPASAEVGLSAPTKWALYPPAPGGTGHDGKVDFAALRRTGRDGLWTRVSPPFPEFRRAGRQVELYAPQQVPASGSEESGGVLNQWARLCPGGDPCARWTNASVAFLVDMFPMALDGFDTMSAAASAAKQQTQSGKDPEESKYWYPTVTLNIDFKKRLPRQGVEWLYSRIQTKMVRDGRTDLDVVVLDREGDVVALSSQIGLVVSSSRNVGDRKRGKL